jgi:hypothetical protein
MQQPLALLTLLQQLLPQCACGCTKDPGSSSSSSSSSSNDCCNATAQGTSRLDSRHVCCCLSHYD